MNIPLYIAHVGLWVAVVLEGLAICVLLYKNNQLLTVAASGGVSGNLAVGELAPQFQAIELPSRTVVSHDRFVGSRKFLLFVDPGCPDCSRLMEGLAQTIRRGTHLRGFLAYCDGSSRGCVDAFWRDGGGLPLFAEYDTKISGLFGVRALPAVVELDPSWHIVRYSYPGTAEDVLRLLPKTELAGERP